MLQIRPFERRDENAVRRICFDTALFGEPIAPFFDDCPLVTDVLVGCYMWREPQSFFVAEVDGQVVGYLTGSMNVRHLYRRCTVRLGWRLLYGWLAHFHWARPRNWRLAYAGIRYARCVLRLSARVSDRYPSTLHVNIHPGYRGAGLGRALVCRFLEDAARIGSLGVHVSTASAAGNKFFAKMGFIVAGSALTPSIAQQPPQRVWLMTKAFPTGDQ